ncbi:ATP-dependent nuclease [Clavibacter sp. Sh2036]|uniref:ATP-dependent nuclease n=1 Tax=Clavibacter sp. Sh2036 TaxID=3397677 RepID=UPI0039DFD42E
MQIDSVDIRNFRCIESHMIRLDKITSFIGPNGAGKSTVLRALDWVFNGTKDSLSPSDFTGAPKESSGTISITVTFKDLTARDRSILTERYAPSHASTFALRREWSAVSGDRLSGASAGYPEFAPIKELLDGPANTVKEKYNEIKTQLAEQGVELPTAATKPKIVTALNEWEAAHQDQLVPQFVTDTQLFGFAGQGELSKIFTYVFVDADLRATDETEDSSKTILGKLLSRALDRTAADTALAALADEVTEAHDKINAEHLGPKLKDISAKLTEGINRFTAGRKLVLRPQGSLYSPPKAKVDVRILDQLVETSLANQGHGFQRAALVASLQVLADYSAGAAEDSVLFLAIEEPELFQHPTQARAFASVLRRLAADSAQRLQIAYATHSLYFVDPFEFHEVRRVTRASDGNFMVSSTTKDAISRAVSPVMATTWDVNSQWSKLILLDLKEALFASAVVLCEGADDAAVLQGASYHIDDFDVNGVTTTAVRGKTDLFLAESVLSAFSIPTLTIWDNDSNTDKRVEARLIKALRDKGDPRELNSSEKAAAAKAKEDNAGKFNDKLLSYFGVTTGERYPVGLLSPHLFAVDDTLESMLTKDWPELFDARKAVIASGNGVDHEKHEATYRLAAQSCTIAPRGDIVDIIQAAKALANG